MNDLARTNIHDEHTNIDHGVYHLNSYVREKAHVHARARVWGDMSTNMCLPTRAYLGGCIYQHMSINMCLPTCVYQHVATNARVSGGICLPTHVSGGYD